MIRREFLALTGGWASSAAIGLGSRPPARPGERSNPLTQPDRAADITLRIGEVTWELAPKRSIRTIAYNGQVPGPVLRATAGRPLTVDVWNDTKDAELVH